MASPDLSGLPKPDFNALPRVNLADMLAEVGRAPTDKSRNKKKPGAELELDTARMTLREPARPRRTYDLSKSRKAIAQIIELPGPNESVHCLMGGEYDGFDLVVAVQHLAARPIDELRITTLGFNRYNMLQLCAMLDAGTVRKVGIVCSDYFAGADKEEFVATREMLTRRGQSLVATRNHAKVLLFAIDSQRYVIESSANLRSCNNLEQFSIVQSVELHEFHRRWVDHLLARHG